MAFKVVIHRQAEEAYLQIVEYLALISGGDNASKAFAEEFDKQVGLIQGKPDLYGLSRVPELVEAGYHAALANSYIILYFVSGDAVHVSFVFHQSQDYARYVL